MGKHSIEGVKRLIQFYTGLFFVKVQAEVKDGNTQVIEQVIAAMKEFGIGSSVMHHAGITSKDLKISPKVGRPRVTKRNV